MADERLERVEERLAWLERHVLEQDRVMLALTEELQRLKRESAAVRERVAGAEGGAGAGPVPPDERPPHY
jgi:SlyX protein